MRRSSNCSSALKGKLKSCPPHDVMECIFACQKNMHDCGADKLEENAPSSAPARRKPERNP